LKSAFSAFICVLFQLLSALIAEGRPWQRFGAAFAAAEVGFFNFGPADHAEIRL
jgi:hypothetical protein